MTRSGHCRTLLRARIFLYMAVALLQLPALSSHVHSAAICLPGFGFPTTLFKKGGTPEQPGVKTRMTHMQKQVLTSFKALPGNERDEFLGHLMVDAFNLEDDISQAFIEQGVNEDDLQAELLPEILREFVSEFDSTEPMYTQIQNATKYIAERYYTEQEGRRLEAEEARWSEW